MSLHLNYVSVNNGNTIAVQIPIHEWNLLKKRFPKVDSSTELEQWQKDIIDSRLDSIAKKPKRVRPIEELFDILDED